jgi:hypothetical protein
MSFSTARKGLSRFGARLRSGSTARIVAFGGGLTYDGYYLASLARTLTRTYDAAIFDTATRGLPGFGCERAVFRTRSVRDLNPDLVLVEFAIEDARHPSEGISQAAEGIVRQLRANDPDREIAFVYFFTPGQIASGAMNRVMPKWESVAEYYGLPSFNGAELADSLIAQGQVILVERWPGRRNWDEKRPIALMREDGNHTTLGGTIFGSNIAQSMITMFNPSTLKTESELPPALNAGQCSDAISVDVSTLGGDGWVGGPLADTLASKPIAAYFDRLCAADRIGAKLSVPFVGRYLALWSVGSGGTISASIDGKSVTLDPGSDELHHEDVLLNEHKNKRHVLELEVLSSPGVIAGLDILGKLDQ